VKETGTYRAVDFDNGGDPWGVAGGSLSCELAEMLSKAAGDPAKFRGWFDDVLVTDAGFVLEDELFDLFFECVYLFEVQAYFALLFARPEERAVECFRGKVGCEEGDGVETECSCSVDGLAQMTVIGLLYGGATGDRHGRVVVADNDDTLVDQIVGSVHTADGVVNLWRAIERNNDVVEKDGDFRCAFVKQKTRGKKCEVNLPVTKEVAEGGEVVVQQWFAACENNMSDAKRL
jgi:hypothetical protein